MPVEYQDIRSRFPLSAEALNEMQEKGWQFIQCVAEAESTAFIHYFKREKPE
jgi:hypothetical protein